jgi:hypothetical protein
VIDQPDVSSILAVPVLQATAVSIEREKVCLKAGLGNRRLTRGTGRGRLWWARRRTAGGSSGLTLSPPEHYSWIRSKMSASQSEQVFLYGLRCGIADGQWKVAKPKGTDTAGCYWARERRTPTQGKADTHAPRRCRGACLWPMFADNSRGWLGRARVKPTVRSTSAATALSVPMV